jgi:hypothetical protein
MGQGVQRHAAQDLAHEGGVAESMGVVRVTGWRGSGYHTGGGGTLQLVRTSENWELAEYLTSFSGACIPGN